MNSCFIDPAKHDLIIANRLTRYSFEEVAAALAEWNAAQAEYEQAAKEAGELIAAHRPAQTYICWEYFELPYNLYRLFEVLLAENSRTPDFGGNHSEWYPIKKWAAGAKSWRAMAKRIRKAMAAPTLTYTADEANGEMKWRFGVD